MCRWHGGIRPCSLPRSAIGLVMNSSMRADPIRTLSSCLADSRKSQYRALSIEFSLNCYCAVRKVDLRSDGRMVTSLVDQIGSLPCRWRPLSTVVVIARVVTVRRRECGSPCGPGVRELVNIRRARYLGSIVTVSTLPRLQASAGSEAKTAKRNEDRKCRRSSRQWIAAGQGVAA